MQLQSFHQLLEQQLQDIYSAETQLAQVLRRIARKATSPELIKEIFRYLSQTELHIDRLRTIEELLSCNIEGKTCRAMEGLIAETAEAMELEGSSNVVDILLVACLQRIGHYEISSYGTARAFADELAEDEVAGLLEESLNEEKISDKNLSNIAYSVLFPEQGADEEQNFVVAAA